jgi:nitrogen fixation/metabolism regulation signal transduction histidine kinase
MLINLLRNAAEAVLETDGRGASSNGSKGQDSEAPVVLSWTRQAEELVMRIEDTGPGLMNPSNAFVPFYTTKPTGSGIGLVLSRQIAEAHGGSLELENRTDRQGCVVKILLPVRVHQQAPDPAMGVR